jgi:hypothetical protein
MTSLQLYALLSPVIALIVMSVFAAVLMRQTKRDVEQMAANTSSHEVSLGAADSRITVPPSNEGDRARSLVEP